MPKKRQVIDSDSDNDGHDEFQPKKKKKIDMKDVITVDSDDEPQTTPKTTPKPTPKKKKEVQKNTLHNYFVFGTPKNKEKENESVTPTAKEKEKQKEKESLTPKGQEKQKESGASKAKEKESSKGFPSKSPSSSKKASSEKLKLDASPKPSNGGSPSKKLQSVSSRDNERVASPRKLFLADETSAGEPKKVSPMKVETAVAPSKPAHKKETPSSAKKAQKPERPKVEVVPHKNVPPHGKPDTKTNGEAAKAKPAMEKRRSGGGNYHAYINREGPREIGVKEIPEGHPTALAGLTFVITGVLESMERDDSKALIERCGGKVTTSLSKKTSYLVIGREPGMSKIDKADQLKTPKLSEDELLELIRSKSPKTEKPKEPPVKAETESCYFAETPKASEESTANLSPSLKRKMHPAEVPPPPADRPASSQLWVDKYRPRSLKQLIGQQGAGSNAQKLLQWLRNWHRHLDEGTKKSGSVGFTRGFRDDGSLFKAALLSGPPGIGKTTTATLVCEELGFSYVELNASDTRSKRSIREQVAESVGTHSVVDFLKHKTEKAGKLHCLLMDEVDGMAGNEDRGGIAEVIQLIRQTKIPIICMCNDRSHMKMRSLVNYCYDLRFQRPRVDQIKGAMMSIACREGLKVDPAALVDIISASNNDVRQTINNLEMWTASDKKMTSDQAKKDSSKAKKDLRFNAFEVIRKILAPEANDDMGIHARSDLFFQDYQMGPLFVQENYLSVRPSSSGGDADATMALVSKAADAIAHGDVVSRAIRSRNNWGLLPTQALFSAVLPGHYMRGNFAANINFPSWLGKFSSQKRSARLLQQLAAHVRLPSGGVKPLDLATGTAKALLQHVASPLVRRGAQGVEETLQAMRHYDLVREDLDLLAECALWPAQVDPMARIDAKTKAALTRAYNKAGILTPYATSAGAAKKGRGRGGGDLGDEELGEMEGNEEEEEEEEDDVAKDAMVKKGKPSTSKAKTKGEPPAKKKKAAGKKSK